MHTARSLLYEGVSLTETALDRDAPGQNLTPPTNRALPLDRDPPRQRCPWTETPQTETLLDRDPPYWQTDICENISFANFLCGR